jgi:hypothetical protein
MVADDNPSGESLQRRASGSASRTKMPDPDGPLTQKRSAAMSAHVLLSEHKQTSRGHRQINAIDPNPKWVTQCTTLPKTEDSNAKH